MIRRHMLLTVKRVVKSICNLENDFLQCQLHQIIDKSDFNYRKDGHDIERLLPLTLESIGWDLVRTL